MIKNCDKGRSFNEKLNSDEHDYVSMVLFILLFRNISIAGINFVPNYNIKSENGNGNPSFLLQKD